MPETAVQPIEVVKAYEAGLIEGWAIAMRFLATVYEQEAAHIRRYRRDDQGDLFDRARNDIRGAFAEDAAKRCRQDVDRPLHFPDAVRAEADKLRAGGKLVDYP